MKLIWFKRDGIFFQPTSIIGWIVNIVAFGVCIWRFIEVDSRSHSVSDTFYGVILDILIILGITLIIAYFTSGKKKS